MELIWEKYYNFLGDIYSFQSISSIGLVRIYCVIYCVYWRHSADNASKFNTSLTMIAETRSILPRVSWSQGLSFLNSLWQFYWQTSIYMQAALWKWAPCTGSVTLFTHTICTSPSYFLNYDSYSQMQITVWKLWPSTGNVNFSTYNMCFVFS